MTPALILQGRAYGEPASSQGTESSRKTDERFQHASVSCGSDPYLSSAVLHSMPGLRNQVRHRAIREDGALRQSVRRLRVSIETSAIDPTGHTRTQQGRPAGAVIRHDCDPLKPSSYAAQWLVPSQLPEQHSKLTPQRLPLLLQTWQALSWQLPEQHCSLVAAASSEPGSCQQLGRCRRRRTRSSTAHSWCRSSSEPGSCRPAGSCRRRRTPSNIGHSWRRTSSEPGSCQQLGRCRRRRTQSNTGH